jgi:ABC-2 type transport system permease protein
MNLAYVRFELMRLFRNRQNFIFSLIFPIIMFLAIGGPNRHKDIFTSGPVHITYARFYLAGMIAFGTLAAVFSGGARVAFERQVGWNRQLRLTPLSARNYLRTKVLTSYLMALISLALLTIAALAIGVHLDAGQWAKTVGLSLIALIPFTALGLMLGHLVKGDSMGPIIGGGMSLFSLLGGAYFPIGQGHGFMHEFVRLIPSFWLVQAGKTGIGGQSWTAEAWIVIAAWAAVAGAGAAWAYRRDTQRA